MPLNNQTRFADAVETLKPLVYRIVWPNGMEELLTGPQMLEKGLAYLNAECTIFEYEHVSASDRQERQSLDNVFNAAYDLALHSGHDNDNLHLVRLKNALDSYGQTQLRNRTNAL